MDCGEFGRMPAEAEDKDFAPLPEDDEALEPCPRVRDVRIGRANSTLSVRIVSFLIDNNIFHRLNPHLVASHEQLAFMVALEQDQVYVPCSDRVFFDLLGDELTLRIRREYGRAWRICVMLLNSLDVDPLYKASVLSFCRQRLKRALLFHDIIPSRLIKRLTSFALSSDNALEDPWAERRARATARARELLGSDELKALLDRAPASCADTSYAALQERIDMGRMARLLCLCCHSPDMVAKRGPGLWNDFLEAEEALARVWGKVPGLMDRHSTILLLCDASGSAHLDLCLAAFLIERGHRVIYAVKDEFYFNAPTMSDMFTDPVLQTDLKGAYVCTDNSLSKKQLLQLLREWRLIVVSDGTRERLNLARVSVTFARAWKEADLVIARGRRLTENLIGTSHEFTRDILCFEGALDGVPLTPRYRPHAQAVRKFSERDIRAQSDKIIEGMREAQGQGRPVLFYSCIIGSIPGQTQTAIRLARCIVDELSRRMPKAYIINPATHFVEGMDGDDLMYMWERVQRSGLISIWYFQTADDIEQGFRLLGENMPKEWMGKDASYSTGCTKEMRIALDVQRQNPEMQIRGPNPDTFFRRSEYGVGKYFDAALVHR